MEEEEIEHIATTMFGCPMNEDTMKLDVHNLLMELNEATHKLRELTLKVNLYHEFFQKMGISLYEIKTIKVIKGNNYILLAPIKDTTLVTMNDGTKFNLPFDLEKELGG